MSEVQLAATRIVEGVWEGVLTGAHDTPAVAVWHQGQAVRGATISPDPGTPGQHLVRVPVPLELLSEGTQTFLITDPETDAQLASFTVVMGQPLEDDIRAELALLRAELDMLKRAFRRHCVETL